VAATPNDDGLKARVLLSRWDNNANPPQFFYLTAQSLRAVIERAAFSVVEEWRLRIAYPEPGSLRRRLHACLAATRLDRDLVLAGGSVEPGTALGEAGKDAPALLEVHFFLFAIRSAK
jgi:hypothetical protein